MQIRLLGLKVTIEKDRKEALGAKIGWWYRIPGDSTDKVRLVYKKDQRNEKRCIRCEGSIRKGLVWDTWLVTPGFFNSFLDAPICIKCGPDLEKVLSSFSR